MLHFISHSPDETEAAAARLAGMLHPGSIVAFRGGLGMGKTCFVRGLAQGLGLDADVCSPTFAIVNEYEGKIPLYHFDMYRIENEDDLESIGFYDYLDSGAVLAIEWAERIDYALPGDVIWVTIAPRSEREREITVEGDIRFEAAGY